MCISQRYNVGVLSLVLALSGVVAPAGYSNAGSQRDAMVEFGPVPAELDTWATRASRLARIWYPRISRRFGARGRLVPITVAFSPDSSFVARTANDRITLSTPYLNRNPDDVGVLAHEMTHVVQAYPNPSPQWLTEGMADYVRYYGIETRSSRSGFDLAKDSFTRGYQPAAFLLRAVERQVGCAFIARLNSAMRRGEDIRVVWNEFTGTTPEGSWGTVVASSDAITRVGRPDPSPCFR